MKIIKSLIGLFLYLLILIINFRKHLLPKKRLLKNEYTDALIDIFKIVKV